MTIELPQDFVDQLNNSYDVGDGIRLPFTAPVLWWKNGSQAMKAVGGVQYAGGWATNMDEFLAAIGENGSQPVNFTDAMYSGGDGDFAVYECRAISIAPIAMRKRWITNESGKGRSHLQMLAMLATKNDAGEITAWGPVVVSAKGLATREIENAMRRFDTITAEVRRAVAPSVPALYFWRIVGTFGEPKFTRVGSGKETSMVTYPMLYEPPSIDAAALERTFVGHECAGRMVELRVAAAEWLGDKQWKTGVAPDEEAAAPARYTNPANPLPEDDFPF